MCPGFLHRAAVIGVWVTVLKKQYLGFPYVRQTLTQSCLGWELKGNAAASP